MCIDMYREGGGTDMTDGMVKRIAEKHSVFQSDVARFESAIREALQEYAASEWVGVPKFQVGQRVRVDHPRFHGEGIVEYDTGVHRRMVAVKLENGNVWEYEFETVAALPQSPAGTGTGGSR